MSGRETRNKGPLTHKRLQERGRQEASRVSSLIIWLEGSAAPGTGKIRVRHRPQECARACVQRCTCQSARVGGP
eukprot:scaffold7284_cov115-Isochrysis_galbana.AAC.6